MRKELEIRYEAFLNEMKYYEDMKKEVYSNGNLEKTVIYFYGQEGLLAEYDENMNLIKKYVWNPDRPWSTDPLYQEDSSGNKYFYLNDHLFTPQKLVDENFNVVWQGDYFSFGNVNETVNTVENNLRFPGQYFDSETGFYYNFNRYYVPEIGRYLREDPVENGLNFYLYVNGNPVGYFDSRGEDEDVADMYGKWPPPAPEDSIPDWCKCKKDRDWWYANCVIDCMRGYHPHSSTAKEILRIMLAPTPSVYFGEGWYLIYILKFANFLLTTYTNNDFPDAIDFATWWYSCRSSCSTLLEDICYPNRWYNFGREMCGRYGFRCF